MESDNNEATRRSFSIQAAQFDKRSMSDEKKQHLDDTVRALALGPSDEVLDVASGTGLLARAMAPLVSSVTCVDATAAMLEAGQRAAQQEHLANLSFVEGYAEKLPFADEHFDVVTARLCFHHFSQIEAPFAQMDRVLRPGGKLVIIDMAAAQEALRDKADEIEVLRDPSHVRKRSREEFLALYHTGGYEVIQERSARFPIDLESWMELTKTPMGVKRTISRLMAEELDGGPKTGFAPYRKDGAIIFDQPWLFFIGIKP